MPSTELTTKETAELDGLVKTVKAGIGAFVEVGNALNRIRMGKLWRAKAKNFEDFCAAEFGFKKSRAYQLISEAKAADDVFQHAGKSVGSESKTKVLPNARQAAEVAKVAPEQRADVWEAVIEAAPKDDAGKPQVTAAHVREVVEKITTPSAPPKFSAEPWGEYNARLQRVIDLLNEAKNEIFALADDRGDCAAFANWIEKRRYETFFNNSTAILDGQIVYGWTAETPKAKKRCGDRIFVYRLEAKSVGALKGKVPA